MWKNRDSYLVDTYKQRTTLCQANLVTTSVRPNNSANIGRIYEGDDFDAGKDEMSIKAQSFASLYSIEQVTPNKPLCKNNNAPVHKVSDILIRSRQIYKRGQLEALLNHTKIIKKRKVNNMANMPTRPEDVDEEDDVEMTADTTTTYTTVHSNTTNSSPTSVQDIFLHAKTAAVNTPIANMFFTTSTDTDDSQNAAYF